MGEEIKKLERILNENSDIIENDNHPARVAARRYLEINPNFLSKSYQQMSTEELLPYLHYMEVRGYEDNVSRIAISVEDDSEFSKEILRTAREGLSHLAKYPGLVDEFTQILSEAQEKLRKEMKDQRETYQSRN